MTTGYLMRPLREEDLPAIGENFNHYLRGSFAAYLVDPVDLGFFQFLQHEAGSCPALIAEQERSVAGPGMIWPYLHFPSFQRTAQVSSFILPEHTHKGVGSLLFAQLMREARARGIRMLLANISSRNEPSPRFHEKHGFLEVGRLRWVGEKFGQQFDVVRMQKEVE